LIRHNFIKGGEPGPIVDLLSDNYTAVAQTVNLIAEWLILTGIPVQDVQLLVENHLRNLIMKHFDPKKADTIFNLEGGAPAWLTEMIEHSIWRFVFNNLIYSISTPIAQDSLMMIIIHFTSLSMSVNVRRWTDCIKNYQDFEIKITLVSIIKYSFFIEVRILPFL
jgi:hypothetical protein